MNEMVVVLSELFDELKDVEKLMESEKFKGLDAKYVKGFKDCLEVVTRKALEIAVECETDFGLEEMPVVSGSIN